MIAEIDCVLLIDIVLLSMLVAGGEKVHHLVGS